MIPKGAQRAGGQRLATHLLNEFDNDRVEVAEVRGAIAPDLHGAFAEWSATATGTKCRKYLYSLSINPDPEQGPLTREQYRDFIDRTEKQLGLGGQPRAIVFHVKYGREHCHCVWSRIDTVKMKAVQLSNDRHALRAVVLDFARAHGLALPQGTAAERRQDDRRQKRAENLAEQQQEERTGITKEERVRSITEAWHQSDDGKAFAAALEARGYLLARGDRRAYVVVDRFGEIHALARQIEGVRTAAVKERLAVYPIDALPDAKRAQDFARARREAASQRSEDFQKAARERRAALESAHARRRGALEARHQKLVSQHRSESEALREAQTAEVKGVLSDRLRRQPKGMLGFLARITGVKLLIAQRQKRQDALRDADHKRQKQALERRHSREVHEFRHHFRALTAVEKRERRSLETLLRRERIAREAPAGQDTARPVLREVWGNVAAYVGARETTKNRRAGGRASRAFNAEASGAPARVPRPQRRDETGRPRPPERETAMRTGARTRETFNEAAAGTPVAPAGEPSQAPAPQRPKTRDRER